MPAILSQLPLALSAEDLAGWLNTTLLLIKVVIGFSIIIFVHELGHFLAAKFVGVRVDRFAIGFGYRLFGFRKGEGLTLGRRPEYSAEQLRERRFGETDYCFNALPFGGYVKMLGQDDIVIDEKTEEISLGTDPRAFPNRPVGQRMLIASAGVLFNLLFAFVLLIAVFMLGLQQEEPVVGEVMHDSPALGQLLPGDRILEVNGTHVNSFRDIIRLVVFSEGDVRLQIERNGKVLPKDVVVTPKVDPEKGLRMINITYPYSTEVGQDIPRVDDHPGVRAGDRIVAVGDSPAFSLIDLNEAIQRSAGNPVDVTVERRDPRDPNQVVRERATLRGELVLEAAEMTEVAGFPPTDTNHLLGFLPRRAISWVQKDSPAEEAGLKNGDVVVQWGKIANPRFSEMIDIIRASKYKPIHVRVERAGQEIELDVTPRPLQLWGDTSPRIGANIGSRGEDDRPVVADVVPKTPAAELNMPRGSLLLSVNDVPVKTWRALIDVLLDSAGKSVKVKYRAGADELTGTLRVPSSLVNEAGVPAMARIDSVDGQTTAEVATPTGMQKMSVSLDIALRAALEKCIGRTVKISYVLHGNEGARTAEFAVTRENYDPWQMRIRYVLPLNDLKLQPKMISVKACNPIEAISMGTSVLLNNLTEMYMVFKQVMKQKMSMQNMAGPVGIVGMAIEQARAGFSELLFFLAFLSVNLAVLNFLPIPVLDGGMMVFLIIEKLKGKPLSFKTQMISTMVGLAAILLMVVVVTIQDISRWFQ